MVEIIQEVKEREQERERTFHPHTSVPGTDDLMVNPTGTSSSACSAVRLWEEVPMCGVREPRGEDFPCVCVRACVHVCEGSAMRPVRWGFKGCIGVHMTSVEMGLRGRGDSRKSETPWWMQNRLSASIY